MFYPSLYNIPGKTLLGPVYMEVEEESRLRIISHFKFHQVNMTGGVTRQGGLSGLRD